MRITVLAGGTGAAKFLRGLVRVIPATDLTVVVNTGDEPLRIYTIYAPPEHRDGTVHVTQADADAAEEHFDGKTSE